jgi:cytochrome d ubiquinol oxidase subunit II
MSIDLPLVWAGIIAFGVFMYVLLDGFDLGIGILFPFARSGEDRDLMMNSVAPIWDGNETWLVLGGTGLLAAFPLAYSTILPALYIPVLIMLIALIFRGVAFEFRFRANTKRWLWDWSFTLGSAMATFAQGVVLGAFIRGFEIEGRHFAGGLFDWVNPFTLMTGFGLLAGYALLGATWLIIKTEGRLQAWARRITIPILGIVLAFIAVVSVWTPLMHEEIAGRWFSWPNIALLSPVPMATAALAYALFSGVRRNHELTPFLSAVGLFALSYIGLAISIWPNVVPPDISIWEASSSPATQRFLLYGVAVVVPLILLYTAYSYYVFRGKVRADAGYH